MVEKEDIQPHTSYTVKKVVGHLNGALLLEHYGFAWDGEITPEDFSEYSKPGSRGWRDNIRRYQEDQLFTPDEALTEIRRLEADKSKLEKEFTGVRDLVTSKLNRAAELVDEAAALTTERGKSFYDMIQECVPLYTALKKGGWSHSTLQCKVG